MPDITPIHPANHVKKPETSYRKLQQKSTLLTESPSFPSKEKSDGFGLEIMNQINNDLDKLSAQAPLSPQNLQKIQAELSILHKLPSEQLQELDRKVRRNLRSIKIFIEGLKKDQKIDPKIANTILSSIQKFTSKDSLSNKEVKKLKATLDDLEQNVKELIADKKIDPPIANILILFLAFAKAQMDQNDKQMLAGIEQTKVKTTQLELESQRRKDIADESTSAKHISKTNTILIGVGILLFGALVGVFTGGIGTMIVGALLGGTAAVVGVGSAYGYAKDNLDNPGVSGLVEEGPDDFKMSTMQALLSYLNTKVNTISSSLGFIEKTFVEHVSERSMQLGQQAGQSIRDLGDMMKAG